MKKLNLNSVRKRLLITTLGVFLLSNSFLSNKGYCTDYSIYEWHPYTATSSPHVGNLTSWQQSYGGSLEGPALNVEVYMDTFNYATDYTTNDPVSGDGYYERWAFGWRYDYGNKSNSSLKLDAMNASFILAGITIVDVVQRAIEAGEIME